MKHTQEVFKLDLQAVEIRLEHFLHPPNPAQSNTERFIHTKPDGFLFLSTVSGTRGGNNCCCRTIDT